MTDTSAIHQTIAEGIRERLRLQYASPTAKATAETEVAEFHNIRKDAEAVSVLKANDYAEQQSAAEAEADELDILIGSLHAANANDPTLPSIRRKASQLRAKAARLQKVVDIYDA